MARDYDLTPRPVAPVATKYRRIQTQLPVPESIPILEALRKYEPIAMGGQPPVVWDRAENFQVFDAYGNAWIDWSSGVLITNAGHGRKEIIDAIVAQAQHGLLTNYCFPSAIRAQLVQRLSELMPEPLKKVFLLTVGSETVECAIKLARTYGAKVGGKSKHVIISFEKAFHGRTLGSQQAGGIPALKEWIVNVDPGFVQVPFPDGFRTADTSFDFFLNSLKMKGVTPERTAGVMLETYQGGSASFAPVEYMRRMREWCDKAGLSECSAHGLRKACARRLAEAGPTEHEIMEVTGHKTLAEVQRYTETAMREGLADSAHAKLLSRPNREQTVVNLPQRFAKKSTKAMKRKNN